MDLIIIAGFMASAILLAFIAGQLFQLHTRKEHHMANKSADLATLIAATVAALQAKDATIADLQAQLAAVDTTATADLAADEQAIADASAALTGAGVTV